MGGYFRNRTWQGIAIILIFLSGCASIPKAKYMEILKTMEEEAIQGERSIVLLYSGKKQAFLMAFAKVGFDPFEVDKLMTERDNKELCIKKFVVKNRKKLLLTGDLTEILTLKRVLERNSIGTNFLIEHLELNYRAYLKLQGLRGG